MTIRLKPGNRCDVNGNLKLLVDQEIKRQMAPKDAMKVLQLK